LAENGNFERAADRLAGAAFARFAATPARPEAGFAQIPSLSQLGKRMDVMKQRLPRRVTE